MISIIFRVDQMKHGPAEVTLSPRDTPHTFLQLIFLSYTSYMIKRVVKMRAASLACTRKHAYAHMHTHTLRVSEAKANAIAFACAFACSRMLMLKHMLAHLLVLMRICMCSRTCMCACACAHAHMHMHEPTFHHFYEMILLVTVFCFSSRKAN